MSFFQSVMPLLPSSELPTYFSGKRQAVSLTADSGSYSQKIRGIFNYASTEDDRDTASGLEA